MTRWSWLRAGLGLAALAARGRGLEVLELEEGLLQVDDDGDGVLDLNLVVQRGPQLDDALAEALESEGLVPPLMAVGVMPDESLFSRLFGESADVVFLKVGTELRDVDALFEPLEGLRGANAKAKRAMLQRWMPTILKVDVGFVNFEDEEAELFWVRPDGTLQPAGLLTPGERMTKWQVTYIGHQFRVRRADGTEVPFTIKTDSFFKLSDFKPGHTHVPEPTEDKLAYVERFERNRAAKIKRNFTSVGFKRMRTPRKLMADIRRFWNVNRESSFTEDWGGRSLYANWWEAGTLMLPPSFGLKAKWHKWLQPVLEEWSGVALEPTDLYGIRTYQRGAWLRNHVDREATHAVSAIINVDQVGMDKDWELEVVDVDGRWGSYRMDPGDAMLYESAKCMHGRPVALEGDAYINLFFHYRPLGEGGTWYANQQPVVEEEEEEEEGEEEEEEEEEETEEEPDRVEL